MIPNRSIHLPLVTLMLLAGCGRATPFTGREASARVVYHGHDIQLDALEIKAPRPNQIVGNLAMETLAVIPPPDSEGRGHMGILDWQQGQSSYFEDAKILPEMAWGSGLVSNLGLSPDGQRIFFTKDTANDEHFNVYSVDSASQQLKKWTDSAYVPGFALSHDSKRLVYSSRRDLSEGSPVDIRIVDLTSGEDRLVFSDDAMEVKFPWASFAWSIDNQTVYASAQYGRDRTLGTLVRFDAIGPANPEVLMPKTANRELPKLSKTSVWGPFLFFMSPETGSRAVMALNLDTREVSTNYRVDGSNIFHFSVAGADSDHPTLVAVADGIRGSRVAALVRQDGTWKVKSVTALPYSSTSLLDATEAEALVSGSSALDPSVVVKVNLNTSDVQTVAAVQPQSLAQAIHCNVEEVFFKTFDNLTYVFDGETKTGEIYGRLYTPKVAYDGLPKLAVVQSFYGGSNKHNLRIQSFCAAGITVLSPAVRGSIDMGATYERLNDGDLGGKEIVDGQYAARWLKQRLHLKSWQIGAWGHSHGGYETQRHLTIPQSTTDAGFDWGFGISESGFSSIRGQYDLSNIKAWVNKEAGGSADRPADLARWDDRSPISHIQNLRAPLLLVHGTADRRVPFEMSPQLVQAANAAHVGHLVKLAPIEGAGHVLDDGPIGRQAFSAILKFLERDLLPPPPPTQP